MEGPKIKVVTRLIKSECWNDGFPIHCVKYGQDKYSSDYGLDKTFKEIKVFEGPCPANLRILPFVQPQFLRHYMTFYSQRIPRNIDKIVAAAVRHTCWDDIFDGETYHPSGKIISWTPNRNHSQEMQNFLHMFLKQEDFDRMKKWDELGIDKWNHDLYKKESV